jgi:uncharacterized protein
VSGYGIFFLIFLFVIFFLFINIYIGKHLKSYLRIMGVKFKNPKIYWSIYMAISMSYLAARTLNGFTPRRLDIVLTTIGAYHLGAMFYALLILLFAKLLYLILRNQLIYRSSRIKIAKTMGTASIVLIIFLLVYGAFNAQNTVIEEHEIVLDKESDLEDMKVVFVSDIHLGSIIGKSRLEKLTNEINSLSPDLILLGGDTVDEDVEFFIEENMVEMFENMQAKYGIYGVLGNHEYIGGSEELFEEILSKSQVEILKDSSIEVEGVVIVGRDDLTAETFRGKERASIEELFSEIDREKPIILMDHQPMKRREAIDLGADLMLSGHSHRGQMFPLSLLTNAFFDLDWGFKQYGSMKYIVSSGYGTWGPPIRIGSSSEIVVINIEFR